MKKTSTLLLSVSACILFLASYTVLKTSGAHPGSTGAPGDLTCAQATCHADAQVQNDAGTVNTLLYSNILNSIDSTYIPGDSYTLTLKVNNNLIQKFGFELVALKDSTNTNIGTFSIIDNIRTQMISHMAGGNDLRYSMTHKAAGTTTSAPGATQWRMKWTAPSTNVGKITFYYATNCTNNNGQNTGDKLYLSSLKIKPYVDPNAVDTTQYAGIRETTVHKNLNAYYNSDSKTLNVKFASDKFGKGKAMIFDVNGKLIKEQEMFCGPGEQTQKINLSQQPAQGTYLVKLVLDGNKVYSTKILIE